MIACDCSMRIPGADLEVAGVELVGRYLPPGNDPLSHDELVDLTDHGRGVFTIHEGANNAALGGYQAGRADAQSAIANAQALGQPAGSSITLPVDFDAEGAGQLSIVLNYFMGAQLVRTAKFKLSGYGGDGVLIALFNNGLIDCALQSAAWNRHGGCPKAALIQQYPAVTLPDGISVDPDLLRTHFVVGNMYAWNLNGLFPPKPVPVPVPPPKPPEEAEVHLVILAHPNPEDTRNVCLTVETGTWFAIPDEPSQAYLEKKIGAVRDPSAAETSAEAPEFPPASLVAVFKEA